jgi:phenylalanine-4-hydroxylase
MSIKKISHQSHQGRDYVIPQDWERFTSTDHAVWDQLFDRQTKLLPGRAAQEFLDGLGVLRMNQPGIPRFDDLSERLMKLTGWQIVAVPGLIPDEVFFEHLANRRFVSGNFIRTPEQLAYLQEPDVFHDVFGHVPLLAHPVFADYMQAYGEGGLRAAKLGRIENLARLYWYTVEFGLVRSNSGLRIYGAGIVSSYGESIFALDDTSPNQLGFDLKRLMRTKYRIDDYQQSYFVIESFEDLLRQTLDTDFCPLYAEVAGMPDIETDEIISGDTVFKRGSQAYTPARSEMVS